VSGEAPTAAVLVIGDEILSGRTKDANLGIIADWAGVMGLDLKEARVVADDEDDIVAAVNALRQRYDYVFTTGGIGPTHDDITADAVGKAFGLPVAHDATSRAHPRGALRPDGARGQRGAHAHGPDARGRGADRQPVSRAPGFRVENVFVMAGIPKVMTAMLESISQMIEPGRPMLSASVEVEAAEGDIAGPLKDIQARHGPVTIGCYPRQTETGFCATIVVRSRDQAALAAAAAEVNALAERLGRA
jgi:molybdenum cofactor synthesis domain-containing protein